MSLAMNASIEDRKAYALTLAGPVIKTVNAGGQISQQQCAVLTLNAADLASRRFNPSKMAEFDIFFRIALKKTLQRAIETGNTRSFSEAAVLTLEAAG